MCRRSAANSTPLGPLDDGEITPAAMTFVRNLAFAATPAAIFDAIAAIEAIPEWIPAIRSAEILTAGPLRPGSRFVQQARVLGVSFPIEGRLTDYQPDREIAYRYARGIVAGDWRYRVSAVPAGCRVEICIYFSGSALLRPIVHWIVGRNIARFARWAKTRSRMHVREDRNAGPPIA